ncbi:Cdc6/Cdc18 family protein [Natronorubrum tibetense]|nr:AAA family ATPase [Natronorubrum tibetense]
MSLFPSDDPIIENHAVLEPDNNSYTPSNLPERENELAEINRILRPLQTGGSPHNALVYGPTGQGKTVAVELKMQELRTWADNEGEDVTIVIARCKGCDSSYHVLTLLVKRLREIKEGRGVERPQGYPRKALIEMVFNEIDRLGGIVVLVLDEIDGIGEDDYALYELSRPDISNAKIGVIGITNDAQFRNNLDADVQSSLGQREIFFHPYDANQLQDILARRAGRGLVDTSFDGTERTFKNLESDVLDDATIPLTAARASNETGDARQAIRLLRDACEIAEEREELVRERHVKEAHRKIEKEAHRELIESETTQRKLALAGVIKHEITGNPNPGTTDIYQTYCTFSKEIDGRQVSQRTVRAKLNDLAHQNILTQSRRGRGQGRGMSNFYSLSIDPELAIEALGDDQRLESVAEILWDLGK